MSLQNAVLATLIYHDIFNFPLTLGEIYSLQIKTKSTFKKTKNALGELVHRRLVGEKDGFYYLKGRGKIANLRLFRKKISDSKFKRALFFAGLLRIVPTLKLVGISGALAMENSHKDDDIDLVLVTSAGLLWTTRFLVNILLLPFKRDPKGVKIANKACLNLFLDESALKISPQNLYIAHEICQMKPLWDRDGTYRRFIDQNSWVKKYLPNWEPEWVVNGKWKMVNGKSKKINSLFTIHNLLIENLLRNFQLAYMAKKVTTEKIGDRQLFFHPQNVSGKILQDYSNRLRKLKITIK